jgi:hypothetical protein
MTGPSPYASVFNQIWEFTVDSGAVWRVSVMKLEGQDVWRFSLSMDGRQTGILDVSAACGLVRRDKAL